MLRNQKGQGLVEFALILAFIAAVFGFAKSGMMDALYTLYPPGVKVLREIDHFRNYDVNVAIRDIESFQKNGHYQVAASANQMHYNRGYIRSGWVDKFAEDANREEMVRVRDELGAAQWTYLNNLGSVYSDKPDSNHYYRGDIGIYWTTDTLRASDVTSHGTSEKSNYSNELVLQYFYSTLTNKYYVIKNYVWVNQGDVANHLALTGLHQTYNKPDGYFVEGCYEGFDNISDAKRLFEKVRAENGYSVIFREGPAEDDVCAKDYPYKDGAFRLVQ